MKKLLLLCILLPLTGLLAQTATAPASGDGSSGDPYKIATLENLYWISQNTAEWDKYYIQTASIDASASSGWDSGAGWTPIGNSTTKFTGSYNGQGNTVSNLTIDRSSTNYLGLFGYTDGATIQNLGVVSCSITGSGNSGALIGYGEGTTVSSCYSSGTLTVTSTSGGLIGYLVSGGTCSNSYSSVNITGTGTIIGGFVGFLNTPSTISDSYATGTASGDHATAGFAGAAKSSISRCYATGNVTCSGGSAGGFAGHTEGATVTDCYSRGNVSGSGLNAGGFIGSTSNSDNYSNCYSTGTVSGTTTGGFKATGASTVSNCFWDTETSVQGSSVGGTGKTTSEMKNHRTFTDVAWSTGLSTAWDFETNPYNDSANNNYWDIGGGYNDGYPFMSYQNGGDVSLSVGLLSFSGVQQGASVTLAWTTASETGNLGFILERKSAGGWATIASYRTDGALAGQGNCSCATEYKFTDTDVNPGATYSYRLSDVDIEGNVTVDDVVTITLDAMPDATTLAPATPNPFNPSTKIQYTLAEDVAVTLNVVDLTGRTVQTIVSGRNQPAGSHSIHWNGKDNSGQPAASGVYLLVLKAGEVRKTQKVMLVR